MAEPFQLTAIRYATNPRRRRVDNLQFLDKDDRADDEMPIDFFVWVAVRDGHVTLIDTGSDEATCAARGNQFLRAPAAGLALLGLTPADVAQIITTHLHWDHCGNLAAFPGARLHVQQAEVAHAAGCAMGHPVLRRAYDADQVAAYVREIYRGRVVGHDGDDELASGLSIHRVGGHTPGMQVVRVATQRGNVVVASDAAHFYENLERHVPFPILVDVADYVAALATVVDLAEGPDHVIPGHDPSVLTRYPAATPSAGGVASRLDVDPVVP